MKPQRHKLVPPNWKRSDIITAAEHLGRQYEDIVGRDYILHNGLQFDHFYETVIFPTFRIDLYEDEDLGEDGECRKILGSYSVRENAAHLDRLISRESGDPRRIFVCWHEVAGHGVLQGKWLRSQLGRSKEAESIDVTEYSLSARAECRLEQQANLFASRLAAPNWLVNYAINKIFEPTRRFIFKEPCHYWLNVQGLQTHRYIVDADDLCGWIGAKISGYFGGLSAEAIGYRVADLGWVRDCTGIDLHLHRVARDKTMLGSLLTV